MAALSWWPRSHPEVNIYISNDKEETENSTLGENGSAVVCFLIGLLHQLGKVFGFWQNCKWLAEACTAIGRKNVCSWNITQD